MGTLLFVHFAHLDSWLEPVNIDCKSPWILILNPILPSAPANFSCTHGCKMLRPLTHTRSGDGTFNFSSLGDLDAFVSPSDLPHADCPLSISRSCLEITINSKRPTLSSSKTLAVTSFPFHFPPQSPSLFFQSVSKIPYKWAWFQCWTKWERVERICLDVLIGLTCEMVTIYKLGI